MGSYFAYLCIQIHAKQPNICQAWYVHFLNFSNTQPRIILIIQKKLSDSIIKSRTSSNVVFAIT